MKVVYILNTFPKVSETFILNEMLALQKKGVDIEIFAYKDPGEGTIHPGARELKPANYMDAHPSFWEALWPHAYWLCRRPLRYLALLFLVLMNGDHIRKIFFFHLRHTVSIRNRRPDHVHAHFGDYSANMAMVFSRLSGVPYSFTTHAHDIFDFPESNLPVKTHFAQSHITISQYNKKYLIERFSLDEKKISVVHCGVDLAVLKNFPRNLEPGLILCVARLFPEKGLGILLQACSRLKQEGVAFHCVIIGEGTERPRLERLIQELGLTQDVRLLGNQAHDQVLGWFSKAAVKVLASRSEGIPVSLMEAMALRVPVVATCITGIPELVEDGQNGFLVPPDDAAALADKIKILLNDREIARRFTENGYLKVSREFDLGKETDKLLGIWSEKR